MTQVVGVLYLAYQVYYPTFTLEFCLQISSLIDLKYDF